MSLTPAQKLEVRAQWGSDLSGRRESFNLSKPDLEAAINAIDSWIEANAGSLNLAIPLPARTTLTVAQKADLFARIVLKRFSG